MPATRTAVHQKARVAPVVHTRPTIATRPRPRPTPTAHTEPDAHPPRTVRLNLSKPPTTPEDTLYATVVADDRLQHHYFWDARGDFVFTAGGDQHGQSSTFFRVKSEIFFGRSMPLTKLAQDGRGRVWRLKGDVRDWENLLGLFTNNVHARNSPTLREALSAFKLAHLYKMPVVRNWAESHLRADFFYTPDDVRNAQDSYSKFPGVLDYYAEVFSIPERMQLDPRIKALALYFGMLNYADEDTAFAAVYPDQTEAILTGRTRLWEFWAWALQELIQVPDGVFHADGEMPCKVAFLSWFPKEDPNDVLGVLGQMLEAGPESHGCCEGCCSVASRIIEEAYDKAWNYLPYYFDCWVPNVEKGWLIPNAAAQFFGDAPQTI